jgi:hypothetical protein
MREKRRGEGEGKMIKPGVRRGDGRKQQLTIDAEGADIVSQNTVSYTVGKTAQSSFSSTAPKEQLASLSRCRCRYRCCRIRRAVRRSRLVKPGSFFFFGCGMICTTCRVIVLQVVALATYLVINGKVLIRAVREREKEGEIGFICGVGRSSRGEKVRGAIDILLVSFTGSYIRVRRSALREN